MASEYNSSEIEMQTSDLQDALDNYAKNGSRLCKRVTTLLEETSADLDMIGLVVSDSIPAQQAQIIFEGRCMRQIVLNDLTKIYEM